MPRGTVAVRAARGPITIDPRRAVWAAIALGVALRLWYLAMPQPVFSGDEAVTGIMVHRMASARAAYVFYAGQNYNGTIEQWTQAAFYAVTRVPQTPFTLRLVEVFWWVAAAWLLFLVGRRALGSPWRAVVAVAAFALGPYVSFLASLRSQEAYTSLIVLGLGALLLADRLRSHARWPIRDSALLGLLVGLALWNGLTAYELLLPAAALGAGFFLRRPRFLLVAVPAAVVGFLPSLVWSLDHHFFALLHGGPAVERTTFGTRGSIFVHSTLPQFLSLRPPASGSGWPLWLQRVVFVAIVVVTVVGYVRRRHQIGRLLRLRRDGFTALDALLVALPVVLLVFVASKYSWSPIRPDYTYVFTPVLVMLFAASLPGPRSLPRAGVGLAVCALIASNALVQTVSARAPHRDPSGRELRAVGSYLRQRQETAVFANYFTGMTLMYWNHTIQVSCVAGGRLHFPADTRAGDNAPTPAYVVALRSSQLPAQVLAQRLTAHHVHYAITRFGAIEVFDQLGPGGRPWQIGLERRPTDLGS